MSFVEWKTKVESTCLEVFGLDSENLDERQLKGAFEAGSTPEEYVDEFGQKYDLIPLSTTAFEL